MADLNVMAENIEKNSEAIPGIKAAYDHEPQSIASLPAATLYFDSFNQNEATTMQFYTNWQWTIRLYIPLNTSDVKIPQIQMRQLIMDAIKQFRTDISLGGTCLYHTISSGDVSVLLDQNNPMMIAELTLTATTKE
jgi:hypothetical protein